MAEMVIQAGNRSSITAHPVDQPALVERNHPRDLRRRRFAKAETAGGIQVRNKRTVEMTMSWLSPCILFEPPPIIIQRGRPPPVERTDLSCWALRITDCTISAVSSGAIRVFRGISVR